MARSDDLAPLFGKAPSTGVGFRQGAVIEWDPTTAENKIRVGGSILENLAILNTSEALMLQPGDVVGVLTAGASWFIMGRITVPNTPAAASALAMVSDRMLAGEIPGQGVRSSTAWGDLDDKAGPTVTATIGKSGKALVMLGATISTGGGIYTGGLMGFQISGATSRAPNVPDSLEGSMSEESFSQSATRSILVTGLNPGEHTFTAKYRSVASGVPFTGENRNLVVIAL